MCKGTAQEKKNESPKTQLDLEAHIPFYLTKGSKLWKSDQTKEKRLGASRSGKL